MNNSKFTVKKIVCLLLCAVFVLSTVSMLASCGNDTTTTGASDTSNTTPGGNTADTEKIPDVPEKMDVKYDGVDYVVLISNRSSKTPNDFDVSDKAADTAMGQAVYKRKIRMYDNYGVNLVSEVDHNSDANKLIAHTKMQTQCDAQTNDYQLGIICTYAIAPLTTQGYLYDLNTVPYLDLSKEWWDQTVVEDLTISGSVYYVSGDISTAVDDYMYTTIFNKDMYNEYVTDGTNVYDLVNEGKWTLDQLLRLSKLVCEDTNGDDVMDNQDKYGLMTWYDEMFASVQAAGGRIAEVDEDGYMKLTLRSERNFEVMNKYMELETAASTINFQNETVNPGKKFTNIFTESRAMFFMTNLNELSLFRNMDTDYGILPNPKYEETQDKWYCTFVAGLAAFTAIPGYQEDIEQTGIITELLGYEAVTTIKPGYYDQTLKGKYVHDEYSIDSLTIILDNKYVDIGHYYRVGSLNTVMWNVAKSGSAGRFASEYEAARPQAEADVQSINELIDQLKTKN